MKSKIVLLLLFLFGFICYVGNIVKLIKCDFKAPYKGEVIHLVGLIPPASFFTFWANDR